jgi:hypothetical protein
VNTKENIPLIGGSIHLFLVTRGSIHLIINYNQLHNSYYFYSEPEFTADLMLKKGECKHEYKQLNIQIRKEIINL